MLWPLLATRPFQWWRLSALRNVRFFRLGSEVAKHEVQSSGGLIITEVRYVKQVLVRCRVGSRHYDYICHLYFRIKFRQKMRIELVAKFQPRPRLYKNLIVWWSHTRVSLEPWERIPSSFSLVWDLVGDWSWSHASALLATTWATRPCQWWRLSAPRYEVLSSESAKHEVFEVITEVR